MNPYQSSSTRSHPIKSSPRKYLYALVGLLGFAYVLTAGFVVYEHEVQSVVKRLPSGPLRFLHAVTELVI